MQARHNGASREEKGICQAHLAGGTVTAATSGSPERGCQSFGGALKRAQRSESFETLPAWWPGSACESSPRSRLIRLWIFEASSVSQTNDQLQLIFNPLKGSRYSPPVSKKRKKKKPKNRKTKYPALEPQGGASFVRIDSVSAEHSQILASICELLARKKCQRFSFCCELILAIKIPASQGK